ncbi:hypothetical protein ACTI_03950 [Actinoplanes sp. OR16]|uniref:hypothetical protein n=1 Tax=Actinoplanes sp. OR16 TaxID=946334 RepID=UPI000F6C0B13|nr:hypothetical protein [Actinoplanes sp. OR16]BBH63710.1 hypothetical protein ACTI_03950 [Actinoplanes sp. OR16]
MANQEKKPESATEPAEEVASDVDSAVAEVAVEEPVAEAVTDESLPETEEAPEPQPVDEPAEAVPAAETEHAETEQAEAEQAEAEHAEAEQAVADEPAAEVADEAEVVAEAEPTADLGLGLAAREATETGTGGQWDTRLTVLSMMVGVLAVAVVTVFGLIVFDPVALVSFVPDWFAEPGSSRVIGSLTIVVVMAALAAAMRQIYLRRRD